MIERQTINGREATIAYIDRDFNPVDKDTPGHIAKVVFDDGEVLFLLSPEQDDGFEHEHAPEAWDRHRKKHAQYSAPKQLKIYGKPLHHWARALLGNDLKNIEQALQLGIKAGDSNTDLAHRVIGSRKHNGRNGVTEITRQHILHLGRGYLRRKARMAGPKTS
jgi:hypothetical protein